jgi:hypothetical protein
MTQLKNLISLYDNYNYIQNHFTDINKNDIFWQQHMNDSTEFTSILTAINGCNHTSHMDIDSRDIYVKNNCKNYMELLIKHGKRGIPDLQFEHALERYIGYLICENKKIMVV